MNKYAIIGSLVIAIAATIGLILLNAPAWAIAMTVVLIFVNA